MSATLGNTWTPMAMIMLRNKYISVTHVLYHLYLALGGFCATYKFVCSTSRSIMSLPNVMSKKLLQWLCYPCLSPGQRLVECDRKRGRRTGRGSWVTCVWLFRILRRESASVNCALYGQNRCLSLRCLPLAEGGLSNRGESIRRPRPN